MSRNMPSEFAGNAGEFFVLAELTRRGWTAALTARNNRAFDILATRGEAFASIRVKTKTAGGFRWSAKPNGDIFLEMSRKRDFCILVDIPAGEESPTYYVVPTTVIDKWLKDDFRKWITTPGTKGQQHAEDNRRRIFHVDDRGEAIGHGYRKKLARYLSAWNLLG
jgi:hypothetical protein